MSDECAHVLRWDPRARGRMSRMRWMNQVVHLGHIRALTTYPRTGRCRISAVKRMGRMSRLEDISPYIRPPKIYPLSGATHSQGMCDNSVADSLCV